MPFYVHLGEIPHKRHTQFRKTDGGLYREEVMGLEGFSGLESILYHHFLPPRVGKVEDIGQDLIEFCDFGPLRHRAFRTSGLANGGDALAARRTLLGNTDVNIGISTPDRSMEYYYRNGQAYEVWFTHQGRGSLRTQFGDLPFSEGDYLVIPFGVTWRMELEGAARFFTIEAPSQIESPNRYRNQYGQLLEHAPYCERDIRVPQQLETHTERGEFPVVVKARNHLTRHILDHHPFDVIGWDGYLYPWAFNIHDFEPITGRIHQPPPVHQTFQGSNFVICSFVPRLFDYHPEGIPVPYNHSNVNSDEVIYYAEGNFMSRKGIDQYDISLHPSGLPHGPQPGMVEAGLGKQRTEELAVMIDTFRPLLVTLQAEQIEKDYMNSWLEGSGE
jgi:homogentisate 1,2-dioxygenase